MVFLSGAFWFQQDVIRSSRMLSPHPGQTSYPMLLGFSCQEWLLHWSSHGFLPLLQACQCRHQEPSHLHTDPAIRLYISITYSHPSNIPSYSPTTRLHRCPFSKSKGAVFISAVIATPTAESPCTRAHCQSHTLPGTSTNLTCPHHWHWQIAESGGRHKKEDHHKQCKLTAHPDTVSLSLALENMSVDHAAT